MSEHVCPESMCLNCGKRLNAATALAGEIGPQPGNFTVCLDCGHLMVFAADLTLRAPIDAELTEIAGDPGLVRLQRIRAAYWQQQK